MIIGVGIDMVEVDRITQRVESSQGFKEKVFSPAEIEFCESKKGKGEHYAARFAAKEAFLKATGKGLTLGFELCDIEVSSDDIGKPCILLKGSFGEKAKEMGWSKIHVSMTHVKSMASAIVIIESE
jgi:holo-[acyl-carrier protein] synthase